MYPHENFLRGLFVQSRTVKQALHDAVRVSMQIFEFMPTCAGTSNQLLWTMKLKRTES